MCAIISTLLLSAVGAVLLAYLILKFLVEHVMFSAIDHLQTLWDLA